jgi:hypothetical protein
VIQEKEKDEDLEKKYKIPQCFTSDIKEKAPPKLNLLQIHSR